MKASSMTAVAALAFLLIPGQALGQGITLTPMAGAYIPASDFYELRDGAQEARVAKEATFGLGLALELGSLRGTLAYATGATLTDEGVDGGDQEIGDGSVLVAAAAFVLRPVPRILGLRPYLLVGGGLKRESYDFDDDETILDLDATFDGDVTDPTAHIGLGTDLMLGRLGLVVEVNDFVTWDDGGFGRHDAFALVGVRLALF